ncbi:hypothetical protein BH92_27590 (plasmid) [Rhodococcoides fascians A21d2]|uniref:hypothetical protein n=1 Tax=Nocardiaceae TaxID=85025 RepID=UPI0005674BC4|nr:MULTISPECIES: hypothetical protein [Rhodococcus]MDJ0005507.1 hypothetical protein [Rhodococcus fascians]QII03825.1 hypothetical protein BH92_27590 [Rhodococcus fascians A21d2]RMB69749.1 hypothetical protein AYK61_26750 [Rhodococcus sp. SBT000017]
MPHYIVKISPDQDLYVDWSTITDCPTVCGDRASVSAALGPEASGADRWERADRTGSSSHAGFYEWADDEFIAEQRGIVRRKDLPEMTRCLHAGLPYPHILHPFEDGHINDKWSCAPAGAVPNESIRAQ